jgi:hypothetical protein
MKTFVKENWYKLMIGSSMMMASFGFMIYAISPAYSNSELVKSDMKNEVNLNAPVGTNGVIVGSKAYFVDGGYVYSIETGSIENFAGVNVDNESLGSKKWIGSEFIATNKLNGVSNVIGRKTKLP